MRRSSEVSVTVVRTTLVSVLVLAVLGCAGQRDKGGVEEQLVNAEKPLATSARSLADDNVEADKVPTPESVKYRGNDQLVDLPESEKPVRFVGDDVTLAFENAPLKEVTHAILSDILEVDYLVDGPIPGTVTLRTRTPIPRDQLLGVLESLLKANNVFLIRGVDGRFIVSSSQAASKLVPSIAGPDEIAAGYSTIVIPLQFISAGEMAEILKPLADERAFLRIDNKRNLLMLAGTQRQLT
ncbi:secretin N-terminal domain-containing protein, partial [Luminiphilus syltensis]|uniref:secretin N-terminal domain-containing protein n=1 Tax=Luminiphilus syltensis TaxID=1341119 RepID=UPI002DD66508